MKHAFRRSEGSNYSEQSAGCINQKIDYRKEEFREAKCPKYGDGLLGKWISIEGLEFDQKYREFGRMVEEE